MLIGLSGFAQTGKDSVGKILVEEYGFVRLSFADNLKAVAYESNLRVRTLVDRLGWEGAKGVPEVRTYLQDLGVSVRRHLGGNAWVTPVMEKVGNTSVVFTDVRFHEEANAIDWMFGSVVRVERPGFGPVNGHLSETAMDDWVYDHHLHNDGDLNDLSRKVGDMLVALHA